MIQRSDDGGKTWKPVDNKFTYDGRAGNASVVRRHAAPVGICARVAPRAVADRSRHGLRRRPGRCAVPLHRRWALVARAAGLREHGSGPSWQPGAGGLCLHTILLDPTNADRIYIAISAAGAFRTDDGGKSWTPINRGLKSAGHSEAGGRGRPLRPPHRDECLAAERAVHAEALGRDAQRQRAATRGTK